MRRLHAGNLFKPTVSLAIAQLVASLIEYVGSEMVAHAIDMMGKFQRIILSSTRTSLGTSQWIVKSVEVWVVQKFIQPMRKTRWLSNAASKNTHGYNCHIGIFLSGHFLAFFGEI